MFYVHVKAEKKFLCGATVEAAVEDFCAWRDDNGFGASDIGAQYPLIEGAYPNDKRIGTVSYNGRVQVKS